MIHNFKTGKLGLSTPEIEKELKELLLQIIRQQVLFQLHLLQKEQFQIPKIALY